MIFDEDVRDAKQMICGANEKDAHFVGVDLSVLPKQTQYAELYEVKAGDACPQCGGELTFTKGIEVGHIFKLGTVYSAPLKAEFLNENGKAEPFVMGTYGMGVSRLVAAVIEQHHDDRGCIWTKTTAPYLVNIMVSNVKDEAQMELGEELYAALRAAGVETMIDDRRERFGFKMKDAELIGFPLTVIIGKELANGNIQLYDRAAGEKTDVPAAEAYTRITEWIG